MRNPFTLLKAKIADKFSNKKIKQEVAKAADTKIETGRSKSASKPAVTADNVAIDNAGHTFMRSVNNKVARNRRRNKVARKSRRINRMKAA